MNPIKNIRLSDKEVRRASNGIAIIARPQTSGIKVMAVRVNGNEGSPLGRTFTEVVETQSAVSAACKEVARWVDKMGFICPMAAAARHR